MAFSFDKLKRIPNKSKLVVNGFIHQMEGILCQDTIIPDLVINLCILFYALIDRFDPECIGSDMELDEQTQCIVQTKTLSNSAFLTNVFESGLHEWKFQINKCLKSTEENTEWSQTLGIWRIQGDNEEYMKLAMNTFFTTYCGRTYGIANNSGLLINKYGGPNFAEGGEYGTKTKAGDIVVMHCDMDKLELRFSINNKDCGKAFDIQPGKYRAVINLYDKDDSITLLQ